MTVTVPPMIEPPAHQQEAAKKSQRLRIDRKPGKHEGGADQCHGERMANSDGHQRQIDHRSALPMQSKRDSKQPTHGRVETVKRPQPRQSEPGPPFFSHRNLGLWAGRTGWISAPAPEPN